MSEPQTIGELLLEKKSNLYNYLSEVLKNDDIKANLSKDELETFIFRSQKLNEASVENFIFFIKKSMLPNKDNLDKYVNEFLCANGITKTSFMLEDDKLKDYPIIFFECKNKIKQYIKLFVDIIEYSFEE